MVRKTLLKTIVVRDIAIGREIRLTCKTIKYFKLRYAVFF